MVLPGVNTGTGTASTECICYAKLQSARRESQDAGVLDLREGSLSFQSWVIFGDPLLDHTLKLLCFRHDL
jgi:hypothetical protein